MDLCLVQREAHGTRVVLATGRGYSQTMRVIRLPETGYFSIHRSAPPQSVFVILQDADTGSLGQQQTGGPPVEGTVRARIIPCHADCSLRQDAQQEWLK